MAVALEQSYDPCRSGEEMKRRKRDSCSAIDFLIECFIEMLIQVVAEMSIFNFLNLMI